MRFWIGVTDDRWYSFLANRHGLDEVNFWHPGGKPPFTHLPAGTPFLFKLKSPVNRIAGGGFFIRFETLPLPLAWDAFGDKNGAASYRELSQMIGSLRPRDDGTTPEIGCSILGAPFFWPRSEWIPVGEYFSRNIVQGKTFESEAVPELWEAIADRIRRFPPQPAAVSEPDQPGRFGDPMLIQPRLGQGAFRALVTNAYQRRCAITAENTLPVLEAAHIKPFARQGLNHIFNGLLLRADFHKLFDLGLVTVTPDYTVQVSKRIREQWYNGKAYYRLDGQPLASLPSNPVDRPRAEFLAWHNENVFEKPSNYDLE